MTRGLAVLRARHGSEWQPRLGFRPSPSGSRRRYARIEVFQLVSIVGSALANYFHLCYM